MLGLKDIVAPLLEKALSFIPDPEQKARAKAAFEQQILDSEKSFREFVVAYEGRGDEVHPAVQILRSSVRPLITYAAIIAFFAAVWTNQPVEVLDMLFKLNLVTLVFWFGSKSLERVGFNAANARKMWAKPRISVKGE